MRTKTILVVYTNRYLDYIPQQIKRYAFNTETEVQEGDTIRNPTYSTPMQVVKVYETECFQYYNSITGFLSYSCYRPEQHLIKEVPFTIVNSKEYIQHS